MPRKPLHRSNCLPYHVTARANNREDFHLVASELWEIMGCECRCISLLYGVEFHAFVLMPNHLHMLITTPCEDLGKVMNLFISAVTRASNRKTGRSGHVFGGPYYWSLVGSSRYFGHALKYVYRNPVKAKICDRVENYQFSTLSGLLGQSSLPFPIHFTRVALELGLPIMDFEKLLEWLNQPFSNDAELLIRNGLRKRIFEKVICRKDRSTSHLEVIL